MMKINILMLKLNAFGVLFDTSENHYQGMFYRYVREENRKESK